MQAAESALIAGEQDIENNITDLSSFSASGPYYLLNNGPVGLDTFNTTWWSGNTGVLTGYASSQNNVSADPQYIIEDRGRIPAPVSPEQSNCYQERGGPQCLSDIETFRVSARGTGTTGNAVVILQSHYGKRIN